MKNALVIIKNEEYTVANTDMKAVFDAFSADGYSFDEVRVLQVFDENRARFVLEESVNQFDNLICFTQTTCFSALNKILSSVFSKGQSQILGNTAAFTEGGKSCFLVCEQIALQFIREACVPHLQAKYGVKYARSVFRCIGANEAHIKGLIARAKLIDDGKIRYAHTRKNAEDVIKLFYDENVSKRIADEVTRIFADGLQDCLYSLDDARLEERLVELLKLRGKKISVAESFTGGGIAKRITSVSGASAVYFEGINAYNELSKIKRLWVSDYTLHSYGAVSDNTAYEMAAGLIASGDCDLAIATTGLAGPNSDKSALPVGLCYIAVGTKERVFVYRYKFDGDREKITETAIDYALFLAYKQLKNI